MQLKYIGKQCPALKDLIYKKSSVDSLPELLSITPSFSTLDAPVRQVQRSDAPELFKMHGVVLAALIPLALGQQHLMLNLDCNDYPGPCNNDCYAVYVANQKQVRSLRPCSVKVLWLTQLPGPQL